MSNRINLLNLLGSGFSWVGLALLTAIIYRACLSPDNKITLSVNEYHEMYYEIIVLGIMLGIATWNLIDRWIRAKRQREADYD